LNTAEPSEARRLASRLAVRWDEMEMYVAKDLERGTLTREEQRALFRQGLEDELLLATREAPLQPRTGSAHPLTHKILAAAYEVIRRMPPDTPALTLQHLEAVVDDSWSDEERALLVKALTICVTPKMVGRGTMSAALKRIGAPVNEGTLNEARSSMLLGRIEAQRRASLVDHPILLATGDPAYYLLDDDLVREARKSLGAQPAALPQSPESQLPVNGFFFAATSIRFSEQLSELHDQMFEKNGWQLDDGKTRLALEGFAWITGDKPMSSYGPSDIPTYVQHLAKIPTDFKWGRLGKSGGMAKPFDEAMFAKKPPKDRTRSARTINSQLSKLATASEILKKTFWLPKSGHGNLMDFLDARMKVDDDPANPKRVPWTPKHLRVMYSLNIWQGGGGANHRLKASTSPMIYQDAAYWIPLFGTYAGLAREEASGLEGVDFVFDCAIPYFLIQANMTRSKDGETKAGLKRPSRHRAMPIHPELKRLGLDKFVAAIMAEGHQMIFPELYLDEAKAGKEGATSPARGGRRFYATAWCFIMDATHAIEPLPETQHGKKADFHSQRTYNNSVLASPEVSETLIADHMGHSRRGTGPSSYNRRALTLGQEKELSERLKVMVEQMPIVTDHVPCADAVNLLHIAKRSRVGSAEGRNAKKNFCA